MAIGAKPALIPPLEAVEDLGPVLERARPIDAPTLAASSTRDLRDRLKGEVQTYGGATGPALAEKRTLRFLIHEEFMRRGIAPAWRGDTVVPFKSKAELLPAEQRHRSDSQVIDLCWINKVLPGHEINVGIAKEFEDIFRPGVFSYRHAERFATSTLTYERKVQALSLTPLQEAQLLALRSKPVWNKVMSVQDSGHRVRTDVLRALDNPHRLRGRSRDEVARELANVWMSFALASGSQIVASRIYGFITGEQQTQAQMKTKRDTLEAALNEVGSRYGEELRPPPKGAKPWHRSLATP